MSTLAIISAILFAIYLILMAEFYGVQPSVSDNYYVSKHPWTFTLAMWTVAFMMLPPMLSATTEMYQFTAFLSCAGIAFVGAAAAYKQSMTNTVHTIGAVIAALFAIIWAYTICPPLPTIAILAAVYILLSKASNKIYWIEIIAFIVTYLTYFVSLITD